MNTSKKYSDSVTKEANEIWNDDLLRKVYPTFEDCLLAASKNLNETSNEDLVKSLFKSKGLVIDARYGNKSTFKVSDKEGFNTLYIKLKNTFAAKVMMTIAKDQNGIATEKQIEAIAKSL